MRAALLTLVLAIPFAGCDGSAGTHIGNPVVSLALRATSSDETSTGDELRFADDGGILYTLTHARTYLRDIEIDLPSGVDCAAVEPDLAGGATCRPGEAPGDEDKIHIGGPFVVDLLSGQTVPDISAVRFPALAYRRIDFRIDDGRLDEGLLSPGDELVDRSVVARADFVYMQTPAVLELSLRFNEDVRIEEPGGVELSGGDALVVLLDVAVWLSGIRIGSCLDDGDLVVEDGVLLIDEDSGSGNCSSVEDDIKTNVKESGQLAGE